MRRASYIPKTPRLVKVELHWATTYNPALALTPCTWGRTNTRGRQTAHKHGSRHTRSYARGLAAAFGFRIDHEVSCRPSFGVVSQHKTRAGEAIWPTQCLLCRPRRERLARASLIRFDPFFELIDWPEGTGKFCIMICLIRTHRSFVDRLWWRSRSPWRYRPMQSRRVSWRLLWQRHRMQPRRLRRRLRMQLMRPANQASPVLTRITALTWAAPKSIRMTTDMTRL
jgi:hypothetical protein